MSDKPKVTGKIGVCANTGLPLFACPCPNFVPWVITIWPNTTAKQEKKPVKAAK